MDMCQAMDHTRKVPVQLRGYAKNEPLCIIFETPIIFLQHPTMSLRRDFQTILCRHNGSNKTVQTIFSYICGYVMHDDHTLLQEYITNRPAWIISQHGVIDTLYIANRMTMSDRSQLFIDACTYGYIRLVMYIVINFHTVYVYDVAIEAAAGNGHLDVVQLLCPYCSVYVSSLAIPPAAKNGHLDIVQFLCSVRGVDPTIWYNDAVIRAAEHGHLEVVRFLCSLRDVNPSARDNLAITMAASNGHLDITRFLYTQEGVDPSGIGVWASSNNQLDVVKFCCTTEYAQTQLSIWLETAAAHGCLDIVKFLCSLPNVDPCANNQKAFTVAVLSGKLEVVKFLCTHASIDPAIMDNIAIRTAACYGYLDIVKFLCTIDAVDPTAENNAAIQGARQNDHTSIVNFLHQYVR